MDSDGQQIDFRLISSNQQSHYRQPSCDYFQGQGIQHYFNNQRDDDYKQACATGIIQDNPYEPEDQSETNNNQNSKCKSGLFKLKQGRKKKFIQISRRTKEKYINCKKGNKRETSLLNINFKTFLSGLLREYLIFGNATQYEQQKISQFLKSKANFFSFQKLYGFQQKRKNINQLNQKIQVTIKQEHDNLRKFLLSKFEDGSFMEKIMTNKKMSYQNKMSIVKFSVQIRKGCINPQAFNNWKTSNLV